LKRLAHAFGGGCEQERLLEEIKTQQRKVREQREDTFQAGANLSAEIRPGLRPRELLKSFGLALSTPEVCVWLPMLVRSL